MAISNQIEFETPENVLVSYQQAGIGTRFIAWLLDQIVSTCLMIVIFIGLLIAGLAGGSVMEDLGRSLEEASRDGSFDDFPIYLLGIIMLVIGLGRFVYYGLSELLMHGQTYGKRRMSLRVVKANGFALDAGSILIRNLFRVIDHLPLVWIVPLVSKRGQRLGDLVAGTVLVSEAPAPISPLRERLLAKRPAEALFRFDPVRLAKLQPIDFEAIERFLERWGSLTPEMQTALADKLSRSLAEKLDVDPPPTDRRAEFLEDLLAAEYRRQARHLG